MALFNLLHIGRAAIRSVNATHLDLGAHMRVSVAMHSSVYATLYILSLKV